MPQPNDNSSWSLTLMRHDCFEVLCFPDSSNFHCYPQPWSNEQSIHCKIHILSGFWPWCIVTTSNSKWCLLFYYSSPSQNCRLAMAWCWWALLEFRQPQLIPDGCVLAGRTANVSSPQKNPPKIKTAVAKNGNFFGRGNFLDPKRGEPPILVSSC